MQALVNTIITVVFNPILRLLIGVGLVLFVWGIIEFLWDLNRGGHGEAGKQHMLWGLAGMFVMASAYAIVTLLAGFVCQGGGLAHCYN